MSVLGNLFRHIPTKFDNDLCSNTFVRCPSCGSWSDTGPGNSCCPYCGRDFCGDEDTQCGIHPPGWSDED